MRCGALTCKILENDTLSSKAILNKSIITLLPPTGTWKNAAILRRKTGTGTGNVRAI